MLFVVPPCFSHASRRMPHGVRPIKAILSRCHGRARRSLCRPEDGGRCAAPEPCSALHAYPVAPNRDSLKRSGTLTLSFIAFANFIRLQNSISYFVLLVNGCFFVREKRSAHRALRKKRRPMPDHGGSAGARRRGSPRSAQRGPRAYDGLGRGNAQPSHRGAPEGRAGGGSVGMTEDAQPPHTGTPEERWASPGVLFAWIPYGSAPSPDAGRGRPARVSRSGGGARRCPQTPVRSRPPR